MSGRQGVGGGAAGQRPVDVALVFASDSSGSISNERMTIQIEGHAQAVTSDRFVAAVSNLPTGRMALAYVAWSNHDRQQYLVPWQVVDGPESAALWASRLRSAVRPNAGFTSISGAIDFCADQLLHVAPPATRRMIDIMADGRNNDGRPVKDARDAAVAQGIVINGLPVLELDPHLDAYFDAEVVGGPACFVLPANDQESLILAIRRKLLAETAGLHPSRIAPFRTG